MCLPAPFSKNTRIFQVEKAQLEKGHHHIIVQHHYHDHANDPEPSIGDDWEALKAPAVVAFPFKLYEMLERVEEEGLEHIVSWQPHGRSFVVHKPNEFKQILNRFFNLSKIPSFQRQLNLYGFIRLTRAADRGGYYHERFLRGKPFLIQRMTRVKVKGTGIRARSNPEQEPDFWSMPWVVTQTTMYAQGAGSSSVISNDESEEDLTPLPLPTTSYQDDVPSPESEEDIVMTGWGKPFHYLDLNQPSLHHQPLHQQQSQPELLNELLNDADLEAALDTLLRQDDMDLADMLDHVVVSGDDSLFE